MVSTDEALGRKLEYVRSHIGRRPPTCVVYYEPTHYYSHGRPVSYCACGTPLHNAPEHSVKAGVPFCCGSCARPTPTPKRVDVKYNTVFLPSEDHFQWLPRHKQGEKSRSW